MEFTDALIRLNQLIDRSNGSPVALEGGKVRAFSRTKVYSAEELSANEARFGFRLPPAYRRFLQEVGACRLFFGGSKAANGIEFPRVEEIQSRYLDPLGISESRNFLPVAEDQRLQELCVFRMPPISGSDFFNISHEYAVEDWATIVDEAQGWKRFEGWVVELAAYETLGPQSLRRSPPLLSTGTCDGHF